jgi:hypothetical protein
VSAASDSAALGCALSPQASRDKQGSFYPRSLRATNARQVELTVHRIQLTWQLPMLTPPTAFPICTIANTPRLPEHCIEWASVLEWPKVFPGERAHRRPRHC